MTTLKDKYINPLTYAENEHLGHNILDRKAIEESLKYL